MPKLVIDNQPVEVPAGATILDAAVKLGIEIPTLCFLPARPAATSCMVCVVRLAHSGELVASCGYPAEEGMVVECDSEQVRHARRAALELLLGDHVGDCDGPCRSICPAGMDIPRMTRQIVAGDAGSALATARRSLVLPGVLGRICPAPCERGCRRGLHDGPVAIRLLHRFAADAGEAPIPQKGPPTGKSVAIVGAGPAGLSAACHLLLTGHAPTIFDDHELLGGMLRYGVPAEQLPRDVLDAEVGVIERLGAELRLGVRVGQDVPVQQLHDEFDAVFFAPGELDRAGAERLGLAATDKGVRSDPATCATATVGVFAGGDATGRRRMAVRAVAAGRTAAEAIDRYLRGQADAAPPKRFNSRMGRLLDGEMDALLAGGDPRDRVAPAGGEAGGFIADEAAAESARCLHCDCRKADACKLRLYAERHAARQQRPPQRRRFETHPDHARVVYEPGKCIACGICVRIARESGEPLGLTFVGRGFDVRVAVPFGRPLSEGLTRIADECVRACPTGALASTDS